MEGKKVLREYQNAIADHALTENTIAILPTNSGKTLIATKVIHEYLSNPNHLDKIILFLTPTVLLTHQQHRNVMADLCYSPDSDIPPVFPGIQHKTPLAGAFKQNQPTPWEHLRMSSAWVDNRRTLAKCFASGRGFIDLSLGVHWKDPSTWEELYSDLAQFKSDVHNFWQKKVESGDIASEEPLPAPPPDIAFSYRRNWKQRIDELRAVLGQEDEEQMSDTASENTYNSSELNEGARPVQLRNDLSLSWPRLIFATPNLACAFFETGFLRMDKLALIVIDECHHIDDNHPYSVIMKRFYHIAAFVQQNTMTPLRPRILGLTASPLDKRIDAHQLVRNNLLVEQQVTQFVAHKVFKLKKLYEASVQMGQRRLPTDQHLGVNNPGFVIDWTMCQCNQGVIVYNPIPVDSALVEMMQHSVIRPYKAIMNYLFSSMREGSKREISMGITALEGNVAEHEMIIGGAWPLITHRDLTGTDNLTNEQSVDPINWLLNHENTDAKDKQMISHVLNLARDYQRLLIKVEQLCGVDPETFFVQIQQENKESWIDHLESSPEPETKDVDIKLQLQYERRKRYQARLRQEVNRRKLVTKQVDLIVDKLTSYIESWAADEDAHTVAKAFSNMHVAANTDYISERIAEIMKDCGFLGVYMLFKLMFEQVCGVLSDHLRQHYTRDDIENMQRDLGHTDYEEVLHINDIAQKPTRLIPKVEKATSVIHTSDFLRKLFVQTAYYEKMSVLHRDLLDQAVIRRSKLSPDIKTASVQIKTVNFQEIDPVTRIFKHVGRRGHLYSEIGKSIAEGSPTNDTINILLSGLKHEVAVRAYKSLKIQTLSSDDLLSELINITLSVLKTVKLGILRIATSLGNFIFLSLAGGMLQRHPVLVEHLIDVHYTSPFNILIERAKRWKFKQAPYIVSDKAAKFIVLAHRGVLCSLQKEGLLSDVGHLTDHLFTNSAPAYAHGFLPHIGAVSQFTETEQGVQLTDSDAGSELDEAIPETSEPSLYSDEDSPIDHGMYIPGDTDDALLFASSDHSAGDLSDEEPIYLGYLNSVSQPKITNDSKTPLRNKRMSPSPPDVAPDLGRAASNIERNRYLRGSNEGSSLEGSTSNEPPPSHTVAKTSPEYFRRRPHANTIGGTRARGSTRFDRQGARPPVDRKNEWFDSRPRGDGHYRISRQGDFDERRDVSERETNSLTGIGVRGIREYGRYRENGHQEDFGPRSGRSDRLTDHRQKDQEYHIDYDRPSYDRPSYDRPSYDRSPSGLEQRFRRVRDKQDSTETRPRRFMGPGKHSAVAGDSGGAIVTQSWRFVFSSDDLETEFPFTVLASKLKALFFVSTRLEADFISRMLNNFNVAKAGFVTGEGDLNQAKFRVVQSANDKSRQHFGGRNVITREKASNRYRKVVMEHFRSQNSLSTAMLHVLVATSVVEEGFDLPACNMVVRGFPPVTLSQHIQSRGRARAADSWYILLQESWLANDISILTIWQQLEELVISVCLHSARPTAAILGGKELLPASRALTGESAFIPYVRAFNYLKTVLTALALYKDEHNSYAEIPLRMWLTKDNYTQMLDSMCLRLPPMKGWRSSFQQIAEIRLPELANIAKATSLMMQGANAISVKALQLMRDASIIDNDFRPPRNHNVQFHMIKRTRVQNDADEKTEKLWREAPNVLLWPKIENKLPGACLSSGTVFIDPSSRIFIESDASGCSVEETRALIGETYHNSSDRLKTSGSVIRNSHKYLDEFAKATSNPAPENETTNEAKSTDKGDTQEEEQKPEQHPMVTLYPHRVWYTCKSWNSEILRLGGLMGYWRPFFNCEVDSPPMAFKDFVKDLSDPNTNSGAYDPSGDSEILEALENSLRRTHAEEMGRNARRLMNCHRDRGEDGCCAYPALRFDPNPWRVLQPMCILLKDPLPQPVETNFYYALTNEEYHVSIEPVLVDQLVSDEDWSFRNKHIEEVAQDTKPYQKRLVSWDLPYYLLEALHKANHLIRQKWAVCSFNFSTNPLLVHLDISALQKLNAKPSQLVPPFHAMAPLNADGVTLDIGWIIRQCHLINLFRVVNIRSNHTPQEIAHREALAAPSMLTMAQANVAAISALDPLYTSGNNIATVGEPPCVTDKIQLPNLHVSSRFCPHRSLSWSERVRSSVPLQCVCDEDSFRAIDVEPYIPIVALQQVGEADRMALLYLPNSKLQTRVINAASRNYKGLAVGKMSPATLASLVAFHYLQRGGEMPVIRMTHEKGKAFRYHSLDGLNWIDNPETYYRSDGTTLSEYYGEHYGRTVTSKNSFLVVGTKIRQGPRLSMYCEKITNFEPVHAPEFCMILPVSACILEQMSNSPALYWSIDVLAKRQELKLLMDLRYSQSVPPFRPPVPRVEDVCSPAFEWAIKLASGETIKVCAQDTWKFSIDPQLMNIAVTTASALTKGGLALELAERKKKLFDRLMPYLEAGFEVDYGKLHYSLLSHWQRRNPSWFRELYGNSAINTDVLYTMLPSPIARTQHSQVLEFIGDAVLKYVAAVWAYFSFPNGDEGVLSQQADLLKKNMSLRKGMRSHGLQAYLLSRPFSTRAQGRMVETCLSDLRCQAASFKQQADMVEALIGATYWSHFHRADMFPCLSDMRLLEKAAEQIVSTSSHLSLELIKPAIQPLVFHPHWCGSSSGVYASSALIDSIVLPPHLKVEHPLIGIFNELRCISIQHLISTNDKLLTELNGAIDGEVSAVFGYDKIQNRVASISFRVIAGEENDVNYCDETVAWPSSAMWPGLNKHGQYPYRFEELPNETRDYIASHFPLDLQLPFKVYDLDTTLSAEADEFCKARYLSPRVSNRRYVDCWFYHLPTIDVYEVRQDVMVHISNTRIYDESNSFPGLSNYQRLEFLGDSVLGMLLAEWLNKLCPDAREGPLSWAKAILQSNRYLCRAFLRRLMNGTRDDPTWIKPSQLFYHCNDENLQRKLADLDRAQMQLQASEASSDFELCLNELIEEDKERVYNEDGTLRATHDASDGDDQQWKANFKHHKYLADIYEAMVGATLIQMRFDVRAVWEVIKYDYIVCEPVLMKHMHSSDFGLDEKAKLRRQRALEIDEEIKQLKDELQG